MIADIVRFEWRYHTRQISFIAAAALFCLFGFAVTATGFGPDNVHVNSPYSIAQSIGMLSLASVFILAVFCANAVVRDRETQMEEIVFTTSVGKLPFLAGRFIGSFLAAFTAFSTCALGMIVARFMPWHEADRLGALQPGHYAWALLVIALPNMLFAAAVLFALSTITRSVLASYAGSVLIYVLYFVAAALTNSPLMASSVPGADEGAPLAVLLDPFALTAFFEQTQHWTPDVRNTRVVALTGDFLLNRLLWTGVAMLVFAGAYRLFEFRVLGKSPSSAFGTFSPRGGEKAHQQQSPKADEGAPVSPSEWAAYLSCTKLEIRTFLFTLPFLAMTLLWAALAAFELLSDISGGEYGSASYPAAGMLFGTIHQPLTLLATILLIYASAEIVWRERSLRFAGILHSTPASNTVFVASKLTALAALVGAVTATGLLTMIVIQATRGWAIDVPLIFAFAYSIAAPLLLFACIAVVIQTLSPHKYFGMLLVLLVAVLGQLGAFLDSVHPLLRFGWFPRLIYSDMNGFGRTARFHWLLVYWGALTALCLMIATARWRDGAARIRRPIAIALAAIFLATGGFIFYNTNILNAWETAGDVWAWRAGYEKKYKAFAARPQPRIEALRADVDLEPERLRYRVRGEFTLLNDTSKPVDEILVALRNDARPNAVTIPGARATHDTRFNQFLFKLAEPLQPGARTIAKFDLSYEKPGFITDEPMDQTILENGSYIMSFRAFPTIGYRTSVEIRDPRQRRRQGLPASTAAETSRELQQHEEIESADWIGFDVTVSTAPDQTAIAPGRLVRAFERGGRRVFHSRTHTPIPNQFAISSGRFAVAREIHRSIPVEIYYHPEHSQNIARMMRSASDSLAYFIDNIGPYTHSQLRVVEVPAHFRNFSGFAQPGMIFLGENRGFLIDSRDPRRLDLVYRRLSHEIAHQWWGYQVVATEGPGASFLTESLTKYLELMTLEKAFGRDAIRQSLTYELDLYLSGRTSEAGAEPPLIDANGQSYLYYRKGAIVMYALRDLLGEATVNAALRNFLREQAGPHRNPTSRRFLAHLPKHGLVDQWMSRVVLYDLTLGAARSRRLPDGRYEVTVRVSASKSESDKALPFDESIDIGVFAADESRLYLAKHRLGGGEQEIKVTVDREPFVAAVDPYLTRIDRNRFDNVKRAE
jgi:ABC-2 type transport system permease protein